LLGKKTPERVDVTSTDRLDQRCSSGIVTGQGQHIFMARAGAFDCRDI